MSRENVELVMSTHIGQDVDLGSLAEEDDARARVLDRIAASFDPSFECTMWFPEMAPVTYTGGLDGLSAAWQDWLKHWASYTVETEDVVDCGDRVLVVHRAHARRRPDMPETTLRRATIWTVRDHRIVHVDFNIPYAEALTVLESAA